MEELLISHGGQATDDLASQKQQLMDMTTRQLKNVQQLFFYTEQHITKQKLKNHFDCEDFAKEMKTTYNEIEDYFRRFNVGLTNFPSLRALGKIFEVIIHQIDKLYAYSLERWEEEVKILQNQLRMRQNNQPPVMEMCLRCAQNMRHQQIKEAKTHIFHVMVEDPFYFYQQRSTPVVEIQGEQSSHKKLQEKLSELANGVELEQRYIKELLQEFNSQEKSMQNSINSVNTPNDSGFNLPVMPMLRSVFKYVKGNKKQLQDIGIQTIRQKPKTAEIEIQTLQQQLKELSTEKEKITSKLSTQLTDKSVHVKTLEERIVDKERVIHELKIQHDLLLEQNAILVRKNSILQGQINFPRTEEKVSKIKNFQNLKSQQRSRYENIDSTKNQTADEILQKQVSKPSGATKMRGSIGIQARMKTSQYNSANYQTGSNYETIKKSGLAPTNITPINQRTLRKTDTSNTKPQEGSTISIENHNSSKDEEVGISSADLPAIRSNSNSHMVIQDKIIGKVKRQQTGETKLINSISKRKDRFIEEGRPITKVRNGQKAKTNNILSNMNSVKRKESDIPVIKEWIKSEKQSPDLDHKARRLGTIQDKQTILRYLYEEDIKEKLERNLDFIEFKKNYERFILSILGVSKQNQQVKLKHLQKKSTVSIKQYLRSQIFNKDDQNPNKLEEQQECSIPSSQRIKSEEFFGLLTDLFIVDADSKQMRRIRKDKMVLTMGQVQVMTQILAYLIQLKVNNSQAYRKIKKVIVLQENRHQLNLNQTLSQTAHDQRKQLKNSLSWIIKLHRSCSRSEKDPSSCTHLQSFINNIILMMQK